MNYIGDFKTSATVNFMFTTNTSAGAAVAPSSAFEAADIIIYKGSSATQRTSTSGITMTSPFDSITGLHQVSIDLSDNTDSGFWAAGNDYFCVLSPDTETVDSQTVVAIVAHFSIDNRGLLRPATSGRTVVVDANGLVDANTVKVGPTGSGTAQTAKDLGSINVTNLNTLSGHDPGTTIGTSTLTQSQVTGGAYALNSSSFAFNSSFDFTTTQKTSIGTAVAASAVASVTGNVGGNVAGSVGSVTAGVTLADDAITSAKYDESTAFPITSADTSTTRIARTGADSDTLETLSDQMDTLEITSSDTQALVFAR